jgi:hypothetical protein
MVPDGPGPRVKRRISKNGKKKALFTALAYILEYKAQRERKKQQRI